MNGRHTRRSVLATMLALGAGACASGIAPGGAADELPAEAYRLGPGDQLRITVYGETELTGQYVVSSQGAIAFPLLREVEAQGRTLEDLSNHLTTRLRDEGFMRNPSVAVEVANYRPFFILGEVRTPGTYPFSANLTVVNAVATAQGFTYRADRRRVFIMHAGETAEREYRLTTTTPVRPGDTVRIGERLF